MVRMTHIVSGPLTLRETLISKFWMCFPLWMYGSWGVSSPVQALAKPCFLQIITGANVQWVAFPLKPWHVPILLRPNANWAHFCRQVGHATVFVTWSMALATL